MPQIRSGARLPPAGRVLDPGCGEGERAGSVLGAASTRIPCYTWGGANHVRG